MPDVYERDGEWYARPDGPGSDVGPFASECDAWDFLTDAREGEDPFKQAERVAERLGWIVVRNNRLLSQTSGEEPSPQLAAQQWLTYGITSNDIVPV